MAENPRELPELTAHDEDFWTGGARGELRMLRCRTCGTWSHPPRPMCRHCHGRDLAYEATTGKGTVYSFVVNHRQWRPNLRVPYVNALIELDDQPDLRLTTEMVGCEPDDVFIGMRVIVTFERAGDLYLPLFRPDGE